MKMDLVGVQLWEWVSELEEVYILGSLNVYMGLIEEVEETLRILDNEHHSTSKRKYWKNKNVYI